MTNSTVEDDALGITHTNAVLSFKPIALEANGAANILDWTMIFTYFTVPQDLQQDSTTIYLYIFMSYLYLFSELCI